MGLVSSIYKFFEYYITENIPEVKSVDLFFNQFETQELGESDARANPRVLIRVDEFEPISNFGGLQSWEGEVTLFIGIDIINTFYSGSELQENNLSYLSLLDSIYSQLQSISSYNLPDEIREPAYRIYNVQRSRVLFSQDPGSIKVNEVSFRFTVEDNSLVKTITKSDVNAIDLTLEFDN